MQYVAALGPLLADLNGKHTGYRHPDTNLDVAYSPAMLTSPRGDRSLVRGFLGAPHEPDFPGGGSHLNGEHGIFNFASAALPAGYGLYGPTMSGESWWWLLRALARQP